MSFDIKKGGFIITWKRRDEDKLWGAWGGGYFTASVLGVRFLQRFAEWGTASTGEQKEFILRFELEMRPVKTAGWLHLELFNPFEARLWLLNVKTWPGWNLFWSGNLGARFTKAAQQVRAQKMSEQMLQRAKVEQANRIQQRRVAGQVARQRGGHPWPPRKR